ncbi:MAG TPA: hemerythrin domain-containing protein [Candidatus Thermoplasmatota archaeon]|nr:hemerythrin domain-containing protein [Candidatus Thermoplasmatota archaeon]
MDAISLLKQDHAEVKRLIAQYFEMPAAQPERKRELAERILRELAAHERIEEEIFYPAFRATGKDAQAEVAHAKEEHELVDSLVNQLAELDVEDPQFDATLLVMRENVEHHIKDEEETMLPAARKRFGTSKLQALGREMMTYKEALLQQMTSPAGDEAERREMEH